MCSCTQGRAGSDGCILKDWWGILKNPSSPLTAVADCGIHSALVVVLLFNDLVEQFFTGWFLGVSFLMTAVFLLVAEWISSKNVHRATKPGMKHAIAMGIMQAVALLPGVSRSGSTMTGGLCTRLDRRQPPSLPL